MILFLILALAAFLRLYQLGQNPPSLDWDEASLGYNAYSIFKTGSDEYGNFLPFSIRSFNDFKPPAYSYLAIPFVATLGLNELAVRLPSALMGIATVVGVYFLTLQFFLKTPGRHTIALIAALLLGISPWHLQFSRAAFEANLGLGFYVWSVALFLKWRQTSKNKNLKGIYLFLSALTAIASLYSYHSARLVVLLMFIFLGYYFRKSLLSHKRLFISSFLVGLILVIPILLLTLRGSAGSRFNTVSIFTNPGEFSRERERLGRFRAFKQESHGLEKLFYTQKGALTWIVARNYFEHFNFDFLFLRADGNARHHASGMGLLYLFELPLLLYGAYTLVESKEKNSKIIWVWLLLGAIPAALTASTPHTIRSILMLPSFQIISAFGTYRFYKNFSNRPFFTKKILTAGLLSLSLLNIYYYLNLYYQISPYKTSQDWQYGYKQLVARVNQLGPDYDQIIITNKYDQPHIYFAFYNRLDPVIYQTFAHAASGQIDNISFRPIQSGDFDNHNYLIAVEPDRTPSNANIIDQIFFLNGDTAFNLISTSKL